MNNPGLRRPIVIAAGGTGGHVVPALAVAAVLISQNIPVVWLGTQSGLEARMVPAQGIDIRWITVAGLRGKNLLTRLIGPWQLVRSCLQSMQLLFSLKPRAVLGMGGFVSGPVGIAALILRKPLVLHEQNAVAGLTNRYLSPFASRVFSAWPHAFPGKISNTLFRAIRARRVVQVVGNPVKPDMATLAEQSHRITVDPDLPLRVLVVGGSRGARALNEVVPAAVSLLDEPLVVVHQAGMVDADVVRDRYAQASGAHNVVVKDFIDDMTQAYQAADLVICRSGAMTVTELSALSLPSILVPFPYAVDDHQTLNARHLSDHGAAILIPQQQLTAQNLFHSLSTLINDRHQLVQMSEAAKACFTPHAAEAVASALLEFH